MKKKLHRNIFWGVLLMVTSAAYSQNVSFNSTSNPPNVSAVLDLSGCINGGFVLPWMTVAQMNTISNPITSLLVFDDTTNCYYAYYSGSSSWVKCYCLCSAAPATPGAISGTSSNIVPGSNETYSITPISGATSYTWTMPNNNDTIITGIGTNSITADIGCNGAGTMTVTASNSCGTSATKTLAITTSTTSAPSNPSSVSGSTTPTEGSSQTYTAATTTNALYYKWTVPTGVGGYTITSGQGTATITVTVGCATGNITVSAVDNCGASSGTLVSVNPSNPSTPGAISGPATFCASSVATYSVAPVAGATTYTWTLPSGCTITSSPTTADSITVSMGTNSGTVKVTASDACGNTSSSSSLSVTKTTSAPAAPTISGTTPIIVSSTGNTFTASSSGASSYTWTVPAAVGTIISGQGTATITVTAASSAGSGSITATATNGCGTSTAGTLAVTVSTCTGTITLDASAASGDGTKTMSITTTKANDLVIVSCNGYNGSMSGGAVTVSGAGTPTATEYNSVYQSNSGSNYAGVAIYWFVASTAGTYNITVNEGFSKYANFAAALTGFCSTPSASDIVNNNTATTSCQASCGSTLSATLTEVTGSYALGSFTNWWEYTQENPSWSAGLNALGSANDSNDNYAFGGKTGTAGSTTITASDNGHSNNLGIAVLDLIDIH